MFTSTPNTPLKVTSIGYSYYYSLLVLVVKIVQNTFLERRIEVIPTSVVTTPAVILLYVKVVTLTHQPHKEPRLSSENHLYRLRGRLRNVFESCCKQQKFSFHDPPVL